MLNCKQVVDLASKSLDASLPWQQRWSMKLHLMMCKNCSRYFKQLRFLQKTIQNIDEHVTETKLPNEAKKRIRDKIADLVVKTK